jgi:hypothetical protein
MGIEELAKKYRKEKGNGTYIKNNDLLWYLVGEVDEHNIRLTKVETKQKIGYALLPVTVAVTAIVLSLI